MVTIHKISDYDIKKDDGFLFDANIWIYIYYSIGGNKQIEVDKYSAFYEKILELGNPIYTNSLVISEIINRLERLEFDRIKVQDGLVNYKRDFRNNAKYSHIINQIRLLVKNKILSNSKTINDYFDDFDYSKYVIVDSQIDFNDAIHCFGAVNKGLKIVTNDFDFKKIKHNVEIITIR